MKYRLTDSGRVKRCRGEEPFEEEIAPEIKLREKKSERAIEVNWISDQTRAEGGRKKRERKV